MTFFFRQFFFFEIFGCFIIVYFLEFDCCLFYGLTIFYSFYSLVVRVSKVMLWGFLVVCITLSMYHFYVATCEDAVHVCQVQAMHPMGQWRSPAWKARPLHHQACPICTLYIKYGRWLNIFWLPSSLAFAFCFLAIGINKMLSALRRAWNLHTYTNFRQSAMWKTKRW